MSADEEPYQAAVDALKLLPKISPPKPFPMPTLRPAPPVAKVEKKRPLPFDVQFTILTFEEDSHRSGILIVEQKDYTALVVGCLQHYLTITGDINSNEAAGREIVGRAQERELMCAKEDYVAARHIMILKTLERIQSEGEALDVIVSEIFSAISKDEEAALSHIVHWERSHRPKGMWGPRYNAFLLATIPVSNNSGTKVLVPAPPTATVNPYKLTGQIRWQEEQQRAWEHKKREQARNDLFQTETTKRMDTIEDESRGFMHIETYLVEDNFARSSPKKAQPATPRVEFSPTYDTEERYTAATKIQALGRRHLAKNNLAQRRTARDAHVDLLLKQDEARQSLASDPLPANSTAPIGQSASPVINDTIEEVKAFQRAYEAIEVKRTSVVSSGSKRASVTIVPPPQEDKSSGHTEAIHPEGRRPSLGGHSALQLLLSSAPNTTAMQGLTALKVAANCEDSDVPQTQAAPSLDVDGIIQAYLAEFDAPMPKISFHYLDLLVGSAMKGDRLSLWDTNAEEAAMPVHWKALLQIAVAKGTHVDTIVRVLSAAKAMPLENEASDPRKDQRRTAVIEQVPFCEVLLSNIIWDTRGYRNDKYELPSRWTEYSPGDTDYVYEEVADVELREQEGREQQIRAQISSVLAIFAAFEANKKMIVSHVPSAYPYPLTPNNTLIA